MISTVASPQPAASIGAMRGRGMWRTQPGMSEKLYRGLAYVNGCPRTCGNVGELVFLLCHLVRDAIGDRDGKLSFERQDSAVEVLDPLIPDGPTAGNGRPDQDQHQEGAGSGRASRDLGERVFFHRSVLSDRNRPWKTASLAAAIPTSA